MIKLKKEESTQMFACYKVNQGGIYIGNFENYDGGEYRFAALSCLDYSVKDLDEISNSLAELNSH